MKRYTPGSAGSSNSPCFTPIVIEATAAGFDLHFARRSTVLSQRQHEILVLLAAYGRDLEGSWDVPRAISLAGMAEHLGVVRSALHPPLKGLEREGLVTSRSARVIGAHRKRKVYHITDSGREAASSQEGPRKVASGRVVGPMPETSVLYGREEVVESLSSGLEGGSSFALEGLPGMGKTSVASAVASSLIEGGWLVRWATCSTDSDASSIASMWLGRGAPSSIEAISTKIDSKKTLLVLDEAQQSSDRHVQATQKLLEECSATSCSVLLVTRAPNPFSELEGFESLRLEGLEPTPARALLPEDMKEELAEEVVGAMAGHPLGIKLWSPEDDLPGSGAVQEYVETTVFRRLSESASLSLDELSASPLPLEVGEMLGPDGTEELDESAILRWSGTMVEPHHLVRNVRRAAIAEGNIEIHSRLAEMWSKRSGARARRMEVHHRIESGEEFDHQWVSESVREIISADSAAAAVVLDHAISLSPEDGLVEMAIDLALERGEPEIASIHIESLSEGPGRDLRLARLARLEGDWNAADDLEASAISAMQPSERVRAEISSLVRRYDDRLPGSIKAELANELLSGADSIDVSELDPEDRELASLSIDLLRHSLALETKDLENASIARDSIESRMGPDDPRIPSLDLRARLSAASQGDALSEQATDSVWQHLEESKNQLDKIRIIHMALETFSEPPKWLIEAHTSFEIDSLRQDLASHRRAVSHWWYWRGVINRDDRLSSWKEAIVRMRAAGCGNASRELTQRLSREL